MHAAASGRTLRSTRALVALLLLALAVAGPAVFASGSAQAQTPDSFEGEVEITVGDSLVPSRRFAGADRIETSGLIATDDTDVQPFDPAAFDDGTVILARSELEFDALAGSTLGGLENAPIVLTPPDTAADGGELNPDTRATLQAVEDLEQIFLLGNQSAIGDDIAAALAEEFPEAEITRVGGINRFETAAQISSRVAASEDVIIARADLAADALVSGSIAATEDVPILLTGSAGPLDPFAAAELERLDPDRVLIAGGTGAIAEDTEADIQATVPDADIQRVQGNNRFSTAVRFAQLGTDEFGFGTDHVNLARDDVSFDALALGPHAALDVNGPAPIVLTSVDNLPDETEEYFGGENVTPNEDLGGGIADCLFDSLDIAGGIAAVSDAVELESRQVLSQAPGERCNIDLTPETATNLVGETHTVTATVTDNALDPSESGTVTFEVDSDDDTGADEGSIVILSDDEVEIDDDGEADFSFTSTDDGSFTITATVTDNDGNVSTATATKNFVFPDEATPTPTPTPPPAEPTADLSLTKTAARDTVTEGDDIEFTIQVANDGPDDATDVTVTDELPEGTTFVSATSDDGECDESDGTVTCTFDTLPADEEVVIRIVVTADEAGEVTNVATVEIDSDSDVTDPNDENNTDDATVTVEAEEVPAAVADLEISKTADMNTVTVGETITFTLEVTNNGPDAATGVTVTDDLPENVTFVSATEPCTEDDGTVTCEFGDLAVDASETAEIVVEADAPGEVRNTAFVDGDQEDDNGENNQDTATVVVEEADAAVADLAITKTADMDTVTVGDTITFTIEVTNNGPDAATGVTATDALPGNVTFVSATEPCEQSDDGIVTCEFGDLAPDATETAEIVVSADTAGTVENTATVDGDQDDDDDGNNSDTATVVVDNGTADLAVTKTADADTVTVGDTITFTIDVFNDGPDDAQGVIVTDDLPANTTFESASAECTNTGGTVTCDLDVVAVGDTETVQIVVTADTAGTVTNTASADTQSDDPDDGNNSDTATVVVDNGTADLAVTKTADMDTVTEGDTITFTIDVFNDGPDDAQGVIVTDDLPANTTFESASAECTNTGGTVTCDLDVVAVGDTETVQIVVTADTPGTVENTATADTQSDDPDSTNNSDTATVDVVP